MRIWKTHLLFIGLAFGFGGVAQFATNYALAPMPSMAVGILMGIVIASVARWRAHVDSQRG